MGPEERYEDEIDLADLLKVLLKRKRLIFLIILVSGVITAGISLLMTPIYASKAVIAPVQQQALGGTASMLAAQFGISAPPSGNVSEIVSLLKSNVLREKVIKSMNLVGEFFRPEELKGKGEEERIWECLRSLEKALTVNFKQKDNTIEIQMEYKDPTLSAKIVERTLLELQDHMSKEAKRVADVNKRYLEEALASTSDPFIKSNIYNLIAQQIQQAMLAEAKENFAFKVLDPPKVPDKKIKPKRRMMVMVAVITAGFFGIFLAFFLEYLPGLKARLKNNHKEVSR